MCANLDHFNRSVNIINTLLSNVSTMRGIAKFYRRIKSHAFAIHILAMHKHTANSPA